MVGAAAPGRDRPPGKQLRRVLQGTSGKDHIVGNAANNKIYGGRSADRLFGGGGQRPAARRDGP